MVVAGAVAHEGHSAVHLDGLEWNVELLLGLAFRMQDTIGNMQTGHHAQFEVVQRCKSLW